MMRWGVFSWRIHRAFVDRLAVDRPFSFRGRRRVLFVTEGDILARTQVFPFFYYRSWIAHRYGAELREIPLARLERSFSRAHRASVHAVLFQSGFDLRPEDVRALAERIRVLYPGARIAYLDWFAPLDVRYAAVLDNLVDVYVKKQVFRARALYGEATVGHTNLTDYYARRHGIPYPPSRFEIPGGFLEKLELSPNFAFSPQFLPRFLRAFPERRRSIDLHARITVKGTEWYSRMREEALAAVDAIAGIRTVSRGRVCPRRFYRELYDSKICFSPFGYGEVCWRDLEAIFGGALLVKPDTGHVETMPDIFRAGETYVPVSWDLSDLGETVRRYLADERARVAIARRAFEIVADFLSGDRFLAGLERILDRLLGGRSAAPEPAQAPGARVP